MTGLAVCCGVPPCILIRSATVDVVYSTRLTLLAKNSPPDCFLRFRPSQVQVLIKQNKKSKPDLKVKFGFLVEVTGLEPAASASRTQRSTKLSHTSITNIYFFKKYVLNSQFALLRSANSCGTRKNLDLGAVDFFDRCAFLHSLFPPPAAFVLKATKLSHTSITNIYFLKNMS